MTRLRKAVVCLSCIVASVHANCCFSFTDDSDVCGSCDSFSDDGNYCDGGKTTCEGECWFTWCGATPTPTTHPSIAPTSSNPSYLERARLFSQQVDRHSPSHVVDRSSSLHTTRTAPFGHGEDEPAHGRLDLESG